MKFLRFNWVILVLIVLVAALVGTAVFAYGANQRATVAEAKAEASADLTYQLCENASLSSKALNVQGKIIKEFLATAQVARSESADNPNATDRTRSTDQRAANEFDALLSQVTVIPITDCAPLKP